jgi:opacity protein-like surface antigen
MNGTVRGARGHNRSGLLGICSATLVLAVVHAAQAEDFNLIQETGQVSLGVFTNDSEIKIRVDAEGQEGTVIDWGRTVGDSGDVTRFRLDGLWRFNPRHHLRVMYTDYSSNESRTIEDDIVWQGETFPASATVRSELGFEVIEAAYEYGFIHSEKYELAASIGLHYTRFEASLRATVDLGGGGGAVEIGGPASVDAPLPVVGVRGMWRMGGDFYLDAQAQYFALSFDNLDGSIVNYRAAVIWQPRKYIGIGAGYDNFQIDVDVEKENLAGALDWTYSGPQVFFNVSF